MTLSMHARLIGAAAIVMACFFGITGWTLDSIYRHDAEDALRGRLQSDAYALIAAAELDENGILRLSYLLPDQRFLSATSNVYAQIKSNDDGQIWRSASLSRANIPFSNNLKSAESHFERLNTSDGQAVYAFSLGVAWQGNNVHNGVYTVSVAVNLRDFTEKIEHFRSNLWSWLGGVALLLLAAQSAILRWGLQPLSRVAQELRAIDQGQSQMLGSHYPRELHALTQNLNALIRSRHELVERYRHSLDDLAHSLKTPLAVLRGIVDARTDTDEMHKTIAEQVSQLDRMIDYQLQKAAASGSTTLATPITVRDVAQKIVKSLNKVYAEKSVRCTIDIADEIRFHGDEGDLMELLGNVLDNAYKWCKHEVILHADYSNDANIFSFTVTDDGPGIPSDMESRVLERGIRADPETAGHGIGLAVVCDIAKLYNGELKVERGPTGGASVSIALKNV